VFKDFKASHRQWIYKSLKDRLRIEQGSKWTESITVESKKLTETTKRQLGIRGKGQKVTDSQGIGELRKSERDYLVNFAPEKSRIDVKNAYFWNAIAEIPK